MDIGSKLIPFNLRGTDLHYHGIDETSGSAAIAVIFVCNHCPYVRAYVTRIRNIVEQYQNRNVAFFLINSNDADQYPSDSFEQMIPMASHLGIDGRYLYDESQEIAIAFGAKRTPETYLFNKDHVLVYHGAIDDNWEEADQVSISYLEASLNAVLENQEVLVKETQARGCTIKWKP